MNKKSKFQKIELIKNKFFGKILNLDKDFQLSEKDEFFYHEPFCHSSMCLHKNPQNVLIIGGGDGCLVREILKYKTVEKVDLVEIDKTIINISKKYFNKLNKGSLNNKKVNIHIEEGSKYIDNLNEKYDVIFIDVTDPQGNNSNVLLYKDTFFKKIKKLLSKKGILNTYSGSPFFYPKSCKRIQNILRRNFKFVKPAIWYVPLYQTFISASLCSNTFLNITPNKIDLILKKRNIWDLKYYSGKIGFYIFNIPKCFALIFK